MRRFELLSASFIALTWFIPREEPASLRTSSCDPSPVSGVWRLEFSIWYQEVAYSPSHTSPEL